MSRTTWAARTAKFAVLATVFAAGGTGVAVAYVGGKFLLYSPRVLLTRPEQIEVLGNHMIGRQAIVDTWPADVDDAAARPDWGHAPKYGVESAFHDYLIPTIRARYNR